MIPSTGHTKRTQLLQAKSYDEALRIKTKIHNSTHPNKVMAVSQLSDVLRELSNV
jgi:hypothetical protein